MKFRLRFRARLERFLRRHFAYKNIGWLDEYGERFRRYTLFECRWFKVYLHKLTAPNAHRHCHDHPWSFWAVLLWGGYWESVDGAPFVWRHPLSVLYRTARFRHNVITPLGTTNWSVCLMSRRRRDWGFVPCRRANPPIVPPVQSSDPAPWSKVGKSPSI